MSARATTTRAAGGGLGAGGFLFLAALSALSPLTTVFILPALPEIAADLSTSMSAAQFALSVGFGGLAAGLLIFGPLSDRFGRKRPVFLGLVAYIAFTVLCALAPDVESLLLWRVLQGIAGGAVWVVTRAVIRDAYQGTATARVYSQMAMITGLAPVVAPFLAGQLLLFVDWRGLFFSLAAVGVLILGMALLFMRETLPVERRHSGGVKAQAMATAVLVQSPLFVALLSVAIVQATMYFSFVIMSPFVYAREYGFDAQQFGALFAVAALTMALGNQTNVLLLRRWDAETNLRTFLVIALVGALAFLVAVLMGAPVWVATACLLPVPFAAGASNSSITALTMNPFPQVAGAAAAVLGAAQFAVAAVVPPLLSTWGSGGAVMAITLVATAAGALAISMLPLARMGRTALETAPVFRPSQ